MFGNNKPPGSLFGNLNTSTPTTSTPTSNGLLNNKPNTGSLFGGNAVSTPSPGNPTGFNTTQNNNKPALNLFGNNNAAQNTPQANSLFQSSNTVSSTPKPLLFSAPGNNNTQQSGGLFSNSNTQQPSQNNALGTSTTNGFKLGEQTSSTNQVGGLFGNKITTNSNATGTAGTGTGSLFGNNSGQSNILSSNSNTLNNSNTAPKTSLFGNSSSQGTGSLFSTNKPMGLSNNFMNNPQSMQPNSQQVTSNPYGLQLNSTTVLTMPESITSSLASQPKPASEMKPSRKFSTASSSTSTLNTSNNSTLIGKLTSRLKNLKSRETTQGLFSPSNKFLVRQDGIAQPTKEDSNIKSKQINGKNALLTSLYQKDFSNIKKLTIDTNRSAAKKMRLLSGESSTTKIKSLEEKESSNNNATKNDKLLFSSNPLEMSPVQKTSVASNEELNPSSSSTTDYWCSPTVEQLKKLSKKQLANVSNFVIGRKNIGSISFEYDVDLTAFSEDFNDLFGKTVIFNENKTVEVYPDPDNKPQVGYGLNVPAVIMLQNVYPIDKKTKKPITDNSKIAEVQYFIKRLRNMKEMEFISYNPFGGVWTFKVKHFSVWGIVNEEDIEVDTEEAINESAKEIKNRHLAFPKGYYGGKMFAPINEDSEEEDQNLTGNETVAIRKDVLGLDNELPVSSSIENDYNDADMSLIIKEKPYEPSEVNEEDLDLLNSSPELMTSRNWKEQLELAGDSKNSIFSKPFMLKNTATDSLDDILFPNFQEQLAAYKSIKAERRMNSAISLAKFNNNGKLLVKDPSQPSGCKLIIFRSNVQINKSAFDRVFTSYLNTSIISTRKNGYPAVEECSLNFNNIASAYSNVPNEDKILKLASILFDPISLSYDVHNKQVYDTLVKKQRYMNLCQWLVEETADEVDSKLSTAEPLESIFLYLAKNDIVNASKTAISSNNKHLAVLISLLGSNDPIVSETALAQIAKWKSLGSKVNPVIISIYQLLTGSPFNSGSLINESNNYSWLVNFGLQLYYGDIDSFSLQELTMKALTNPFIDTSSLTSFEKMSMNIMKLFACSDLQVEVLLDELRTYSKTFDVRLCWFFTQMLKRDDMSNLLRDRITLEFIEQLKIDAMYKEALFVACFISNDFVAQQMIDQILSSEIIYFTSAENETILERLSISSAIIHRHLALHDKYCGDYLSEVRNLLKAGQYKEAEIVVITTVAPKLILNAKSNKDHLLLLDQLLKKFPAHTISTWDKGLAVYEKYIKLVLNDSVDENTIHSIITALPPLRNEYSQHELVNVACSFISETVSELFLINFESLSKKIPKESLLSLPLGQPESKYLSKVLSSM